MQKLNEKLIVPIDSLAKFLRPIIMGNEKHNNNIFKRVQDFGVGIFFVTNSEYDGYSKWNAIDSKPEIYLDRSSDDRDEDRERFTLAHELGHIFIDFQWNPVTKKPLKLKNGQILSVKYRDKDKPEDTDVLEEQIANEFAAAFLMPKETVEEQVKDYDSEEEKIDAVVNFFKVSDRAARNRLVVIGEILDDE